MHIQCPSTKVVTKGLNTGYTNPFLSWYPLQHSSLTPMCVYPPLIVVWGEETHHASWDYSTEVHKCPTKLINLRKEYKNVSSFITLSVIEVNVQISLFRGEILGTRQGFVVSFPELGLAWDQTDMGMSPRFQLQAHQTCTVSVLVGEIKRYPRGTLAETEGEEVVRRNHMTWMIKRFGYKTSN